MRFILVFSFILPSIALAQTDFDENVARAEQKWIDDRNAHHGANGWPAGFGLRPEAYDLVVEVPNLADQTLAPDPTLDPLMLEFGRGLFVAFSLDREGLRDAALNERKHLGKILARINLHAPLDEAERAMFERSVAARLTVHLRRAASRAGLGVDEAARLFFADMKYDEFDVRNLRRATQQARAEWRASTDAARVWRFGRHTPSPAQAMRWAQWGGLAGTVVGLGYLADGLTHEHADLGFTAIGLILANVSAFAAPYALPWTRKFRQRPDAVTPALKACQALLALPPKGP